MTEREDELEERDLTPTAYPATIKAAAILWLAFGVLGIAAGLVAVAMASDSDNVRVQKVNPGTNPCVLVVTFLIPVIFFMVGYQTLRGDAKDTLGNGIGSIVFGLLYVGVGISLISIDLPGAHPNAIRVLEIAGLVSFMIAVIFFAAGALALTGRREYKQWRRENKKKPERRKKRRPRDEEDDADDALPPRRLRED